MNNSEMAHAFYYHGVDCWGRRGGSGHIGYEGRTAYSYSTAVAIVVPARGAKAPDTYHPETGVTLVSFDGMSKTTARHISCLASASPFRVIRVPMRRGCSEITPERVAEGFLDDLAACLGTFNTRDGRGRFAMLMQARADAIRLLPDRWAKPLRGRRFRRFESLDVGKMAAELQARNRREAAKRAAETRAVFAKYLPKANAGGDMYCKFIRAVFDPGYACAEFPFDRETVAKIRGKMDRNAAYVWPDGDLIRTSKGVSVNTDEARVALRAWASGHDMRTTRVGTFAIVKYKGSVIQIGCHRIPRRNMIALYEAVVGRPFPAAAAHDKED